MTNINLYFFLSWMSTGFFIPEDPFIVIDQARSGTHMNHLGLPNWEIAAQRGAGDGCSLPAVIP